MDVSEVLRNCKGFDWDRGNAEKNQLKHQVSKLECEQVFFNQPVVIVSDSKHSAKEIRFLLLGKTNQHRNRSIVFTIRQKELIRVISARDMSRKERKLYEKT